MDRRDVIRGQGKLEDRLQYISSNTVNSDPLTPEGRSKRNFLKYVIPSALVLAIGGAAAWYHFCYKPGQNPPPGTTTSTTQRTTGVNHPPVISEIKVKPKWLNPTTKYLRLSHDAYDSDNDPLTTTWFIDHQQVSTESTYSAELPLGEHLIELSVSDGREATTMEKKVTVEPDQIYPQKSLNVKYKGMRTCAGYYQALTEDRMDDELDTIHNELGCNAVIIYALGNFEDDLINSGRLAIQKGFDRIYIAPMYLSATIDQTIERIEKFTPKVRALRETSESVVFMVGHEFGLDMKGIIPGDAWVDRLRYQFEHNDWQERVNAKLPGIFKRIIPIVKKNYGYEIAYAAAIWETDLVPWSDPIFESVGTDAYILDSVGLDEKWVINHLSSLRRFGKPVNSTEWGSMTFKGASSLAWPLYDEENQPYDEDEQANYIRRYFEMLNKANINGCFYTQYNDETPKGYGLFNGMQRRKGFYMYKSSQRAVS